MSVSKIGDWAAYYLCSLSVALGAYQTVAVAIPLMITLMAVDNFSIAGGVKVPTLRVPNRRHLVLPISSIGEQCGQAKAEYQAT